MQRRGHTQKTVTRRMHGRSLKSCYYDNPGGKILFNSQLSFIVANLIQIMFTIIAFAWQEPMGKSRKLAIKRKFVKTSRDFGIQSIWYKNSLRRKNKATLIEIGRVDNIDSAVIIRTQQSMLGDSTLLAR